MKKLLVDTHRPTTIDDYVFQSESNERKIKKWIKDQSIPNVLMEGTPGTGKTTMSRILVSELGIQDMDVLSLNASLMKMEDIRERVVPFLSKSSFSPFKIVQLEEADRMTFAQQKSLLSIIEDSSERTRWILTCNYVSKIDPALISRFEAGYLTMEAMNEEGILNYVIDVIEKEGITINDDEDLLSHIDAYGSDIRKIIMSIEGNVDEDNTLHKLESKSASSDASEFESIFVEGNAKEKLEELLSLTEHVDANNFEWFYTVMYENTDNFDDVGSAVIILAEYLDRALKSANQRLTLDACLYRLFLEEDE